MDLLTHLFLPITIAFAIRPDLFPSPRYFALAGVAVLPDLDKLLGVPGLLHSAITLGAITGVAWAVERRYRNATTYAALVGVLLASHLLLDFLDGGPVPLLYPVVEAGVGLTYPTAIVFGDAVHEVAVRQPLPDLQVGAPDADRRRYGLVTGYGVLSALAFLVVYVGMRASSRREGAMHGD